MLRHACSGALRSAVSGSILEKRIFASISPYSHVFLRSQQPSMAARCFASTSSRTYNSSISGDESNLKALGALLLMGLMGATTTTTTLESSSPVDDEDLPMYTSKDVALRNGRNGYRIWMSYGGYVYDVTDFIPNHPGGSEKILLASGAAIEPYWNTYRQHFSSNLPSLYLEKLKIGVLAEADQQRIDDRAELVEDPYLNEPERHSALIVHTEQPANMETPYAQLTDNYITPSEIFYIRSHHPVPRFKDEEQIKNFRLKVDATAFGLDQVLELSLDQLKALPRHEIVATLQCSGNRRSGFNEKERTSGTPWYQGAISTARWTGVRLRDILKAAGVDDEVVCQNLDSHVRFSSVDDFHSSVGLDKAYSISGDTIIAYEMNGEAIPPDHGFPLRVIVPGYIGVRNVKWLDSIILHKEEAEGPIQRGLNYKILPPSVRNADTVDVSKLPTMYEPSVFSGITEVKQQGSKFVQCSNCGQSVADVLVSGWAWAGGGRNIARVDVTGDGGKTWATADITEGGNQPYKRAWAWVFWTARLPAAPVNELGMLQIASKAVDVAYNSQPESSDHGWNVRGLSNNSWFRFNKKCD